MSDLPELFHLMQGDTVLAVLKRCEPVEMFWLGCEFEPNESFATVESLFRQATSTEDMDIFHDCYDKIEEAGVVLLDVHGNRTTNNFFMHIRGDKVEIRFSFDE